MTLFAASDTLPKMFSRSEAHETLKWFTVDEAAEFLRTNPSALRARLRRASRRGRDGGVEANFDGVRGKKLGSSWRVAFSSRWLDDPEVKRPRGR